MVKIRRAPSVKTASTSPSSTRSARGRKAELARQPRKLYQQLYAEVDRIRKLPEGEKLIEGAELLTVIFELSDELGAISLAIRGALELQVKP